MGKNLCRACDLTFGTLGACDAHWVGSFGEAMYKTNRTGKSWQVTGQALSTRRCLTVQEILTLGMIQNEKGWWITLASEGVPPWIRAAHEEELEAV